MIDSLKSINRKPSIIGEIGFSIYIFMYLGGILLIEYATGDANIHNWIPNFNRNFKSLYLVVKDEKINPIEKLRRTKLDIRTGSKSKE